MRTQWNARDATWSYHRVLIEQKQVYLKHKDEVSNSDEVDRSEGHINTKHDNTTSNSSNNSNSRSSSQCSLHLAMRTAPSSRVLNSSRGTTTSSLLPTHDSLRCDTIRHGTTRHGTARHSETQGIKCHVLNDVEMEMQCSAVQHSTVQHIAF